ncbi:glycosyltransferase family 2 protein, partial [Staphylococcus microti]
STYNGSDHILSTIENVKNALKNFNYEMIIVNDGSVDNTSKLLETFKNDDHFKILTQKNKGISASRNRGMRHISPLSKYVVFIDDSDQVRENFFEKIDAFFREHDDIDVAATPLIRIKKGVQSQHSLNYRFHANKQIVDIHTDYQFIQFHIGGMVFRKELLVDLNYQFDEDLNFWEDAKFINTIILDTEKYGLIPDTAYFYNSENPNSLSRVAWKLEERYIPLIENSYMFLIEQSNKRFNKTIKYIQFLVATHYSEYL